ncbi:MAG: hypothetical protein ACTSYB_19105 [Candidatus Helarchaeota archaeon]
MMKIERIHLYKTGLGFFSRHGTLNLNKEKKIQLSFKTNVMNDILKTLSIICSNGGMVTGVSYEAADVDTERALEDALIRVPEEDSFLNLIKQLVGTKISVTVGSQNLQGRVLGVQEIEEGSGEKSRLESYLVIVTDAGRIMNLPIKEIVGMEIDDPKMNKELNFFLETVYLGKKKDMKTVTIFFEGTGETDVYITYLQEMPSWKTSYRLINTEKGFILQGWALVDNILDEDWEDITLSLISGLPISFIYDLYSPNWISRPEIERVESYDIVPPAFEESLEKEFLEDKMVMAEEMPAPKLAKSYARKRRMKNMQAFAKMEKAVGSTKVSAKGEAAGMAGFEYRIMTPVTVKRNQSSLVPILQSEINVKKLCVYNEENHKTNPMQCLELTNTTDLTLESGPISIFDHDAFAGEAMLPFMKPTETRLIAYAVELGIHVSKDSDYKTTNIHEIQIGKYAETFQYSIQKTKYTIKNKTNEEKTLIIEHPKQSHYDLYETEKPTDETDNYYRYELKLPPNKTETFEIKLRRIERRSMYLNQIAKKDILKWFELKLISEAQRDFLLEIFNLEMQKREIDSLIDQKTREIDKIVVDQERIRENLKSLGDSQSENRLKEKFVSKLEKQEELLEQLRHEIEDLKIKRKNLENQIQKTMVERTF